MDPALRSKVQNLAGFKNLPPAGVVRQLGSGNRELDRSGFHELRYTTAPFCDCVAAGVAGVSLNALKA